MWTIDECLAMLKLEFERKYISTPITVVWHRAKSIEYYVEGCNAYFSVITPNDRGGVDTLKGLYAIVENGRVEQLIDTGW